VNVAVTVLPLAVVSPYGVAGRFNAGYFLIRLKVNATSSPVTGLPSDHLALSRTVMVASLKSGVHSTPVASHGRDGSAGLAGFHISRGTSQRRPLGGSVGV
jgi:hypothetical protein